MPAIATIGSAIRAVVMDDAIAVRFALSEIGHLRYDLWRLRNWGNDMGREIVRVPPGFRHPTDKDGNYIVGAHHEVLYYTDSSLRTAYQLYENVSEGSPVSPVFETREALSQWLFEQGWSQQAAQFLLANGHGPSFVLRGDGTIDDSGLFRPD
jgi:hypothetical protein